ncbi:MAG: protein kinase [Vicinamibacterales bacterium]
MSAIGAGGMGEVYRARDTSLGRDVAIKVLLPSVSADELGLQRFSREAQILASLSHPNIAVAHGLAEGHGHRAIVMEFVDGPTLAELIARGAVPLDESLQIARQLADALAAAHEQGIIHRDLKPANVKIRPDGLVKVLDFGLAKSLPAPLASDRGGLDANSPTATTPAITATGAILGTSAYMSPEQTRGDSLDRRTDVWAFGCVVYELLTARRAFPGDTPLDVSAAVLGREPDWTCLPRATPDPIVRLLKRCLAKDRRRRLADAADARLEIDEALAPSSGEAQRASPDAIRRHGPAGVGLGLAAGAAVAMLATWIVMRPGLDATFPVSRFVIVPPPTQSIDPQDNDRNIAISPDGRQVAYRWGGTTSGGPLMVRPIDSLDARPLDGVTTARGPFFSPDSHWLAFFERNEIRKMSLGGEPPISVCRFKGFPRGASWGDDGSIVFATDDSGTGLLRVSASGGEPAVLTMPDVAAHEQDHLLPSLLPGSRAVLFTVTTAGPRARSDVAVLDLATGQRHRLITDATQAEYVPPRSGSGDEGHLIYAAGGALRAVRFDLATLHVTGDSTMVVDRIQMANNGAASYGVAGHGTLVYLPGDRPQPRSLVWVNRQGVEEAIDAPKHAYAVPRLSVDGRRVAVERREQDNDLWMWDFTLHQLSPLTFGAGLDQSPVWTPDGKRLVFTSNRTGSFRIYSQNVDGRGPLSLLSGETRAQFPTAITSDGSSILSNEMAGGHVGITLTLPAGNPERSRTASLIDTMADEVAAQISPDGHYVAYQSNESGRFEVYVRPFPNVSDGRWQVSLDGGSDPVWGRERAELYYLDGASAMTVVPVTTAGGTFGAGNPQKLFDARSYSADGARGYDVSADGRRFIFVKDAGAPESRLPGHLVVVLNWFAEVQGKFRARR